MNQAAELPRAIGRLGLAALMVNAVIGSSVFGLPSVLAGQLGAAAPLAWLAAAAGIGVIVACFAEVASRFDEAGGPYLYARAAFGPLIGLQMAWLAYLTRLTAAATDADPLARNAARGWPRIRRPCGGVPAPRRNGLRLDRYPSLVLARGSVDESRGRRTRHRHAGWGRQLVVGAAACEGECAAGPAAPIVAMEPVSARSAPPVGTKLVTRGADPERPLKGPTPHNDST